MTGDSAVGVDWRRLIADGASSGDALKALALRPDVPPEALAVLAADERLLKNTPEIATACNCSLCRRSGGPWVYFPFGTVVITGHPENTTDYVWGDRTLRTVRCRTCGSVTHWEPLQPTSDGRHGVNLANFDPALIASVPVRRFDGADTWAFIDP